MNPPPAKALACPRCTPAVTPAQLAPAQVLPQRATALPIRGDVLVDAFDTDVQVGGSGNLPGTPAIARTYVHLGPIRSVDPGKGAGGVPALHRLALRIAMVVRTLRRCIRPQFAADRAARPLRLCRNVFQRSRTHDSVRRLRAGSQRFTNGDG